MTHDDTRRGRLLDNIAHFARALRNAGLPVGPDRVAAATEALMALDIGRRDDFYWALHAALVSRPEHRAVFDAVFRLFWRDPQLLEKMMAVLMRQTTAPRDERKPRAGETRAEEALAGAAPPPEPREEPIEREEIEFDATFTMAADERLRARDFEQMTAAEAAAARRVIARMTLPAPKRVSRRFAPALGGSRADWRATLRAAARSGGEIRSVSRRAPRERPLDLVALCDISGSMANYSRMLLHFMHALSTARMDGWGHVHSFTFGTRLTNISRHLRRRDVDEALALAGAEAQDWEGGTRIGAALWRFNRDWSRRVLAQGAVVVLITDGLDRDDADLLAREAARLRRSARRLIWLCPLLRYDGFAPKAAGVRALLPEVDEFRPAHNLESLEALAEALRGAASGGERERLMAALRVA